MSFLYPILNLIHVFGAIVWAGVAFYQFAFLSPAVQQAGQSGGAVMGRILNGKLLRVMAITPLLVILSGLLLYWFRSGGFSSAYLISWQGLVLTLGALAGIAAFFEGMVIIGPTAARLRDLGNQIAAAGGPPQPEQTQSLQALGARLGKAGTRGAIFLLVAVVGMALGGA